METARTEHCPECHDTRMCNRFHFVQGRRPRVYVQCSSCGAFVARYTLERYTSNKPYESLLDTLRTHHGESAHHVMRQLEAFGQEVAEGFQRVREMISCQEDPRKIEQIIAGEKG